MALLLLLQRTLRVHDNALFSWAIDQDEPVIILYCFDPKLGLAQKWWLDHSLVALSHDLASMNMPLFICEGSLKEFIEKLKNEVHSLSIISDTPLEDKINEHVRVIEDHYLFPAQTLDKVYKRFTPYMNYLLKQTAAKPLPSKKWRSVHNPDHLVKELLGKHLVKYSPDRSESSYAQFWEPGEAGAHKQWNRFLKQHLLKYEVSRDAPALNQTSHLSPYLHFGEISIRQIWHDLEKLPHTSAKKKFIQELLWREFSAHLLYHAPQMSQVPLQSKFERFPWGHNAEHFTAWKMGKTGFPLVDAGMRELLETGFMHNRVRMVVASFLTKHLFIDWRYGAAWFNERLLDADRANNVANWQWVAGCGADAAPFFRIFNPLLQAKKYDSDALYIKRWVKELQKYSAKEVLFVDQKKYKPLPGYCPPLIDLEERRNQALYEFKHL
jgi:deoxyribodipyrimidine photo-lyase